MTVKDDSQGFEPIAIVGIGCRFAGDSSSPSKLWDMLTEGRSGQSDFPKNRFNIDSWYNPVKGRPGSLYNKGGYFISHDDSYRDFDPSFFGISPLEAMTMDPQQRKLLEVVYECFESAGKTLEDVSGSETACYVGCFSTEFEQIQNRDPEYSRPYQLTGAGLTIISNRVNYVFNLKGPSLTLDTACSSSLYALHLACQSLLAGDCTAAVVGGASLVTAVEKHMRSQTLGILSPTSTCHTFDASADGFGRGDGIAAILIKRLSDAVKDGDPIRAVIRATAVNSNGKGPGINHPGLKSQEAAIRKAYARAGLDFDDTGYFECHGTGTPVGDPIECSAIGNVFAEGRTPENPLLIGSVKTNLGHTEGASGLAAIIKAILCFENGYIPPTVGVKQLNPNIDFRNGRLRVVTSLTPWPKNHEYRRASINGFGYGGANAHVILDAADSFLKAVPGLVLKENSGYSDSMKKKYLIALSAHDQETLNRNQAAIVAVSSNYKISDIAYTLAAHRSKLQYRGFSVWHNDCLPRPPDEGNFTVGISRGVAPSLAFVFTGQGAQWAQMGYSLIKHFPSVQRTFEELQRSLEKLPITPNFNIIEILSAPEESTTLYHSVRSPVCCTAVQIALVVLLRSWGVSPIAVVGHSAGEIAAAFAAGLLTAAEAVAIAYYRGIAVLNCKEQGAMLAVGLGAEEVLPYLKGQPDVIIGCHNSPQSVTLSGGEFAVEKIRKVLVDDGIFARKVKTSGNAYHSHLMKAAVEEFTRLFEDVYTKMVRSPARVKAPRTPLYSSITGELLGLDMIPFSHWRSNLELPVLFNQASQVLIASHPTANCFIEIGPHSALAGPVKQIAAHLELDQSRLGYMPSLVRGKDGVDNMLHLAGTLFILGYPIDLVRVTAVEEFREQQDEAPFYLTGNFLVDLPTYQWTYKGLLWKESRWSNELRFRKHPRHDILGSLEPGGSRNSFLWRNQLQLSLVPWLRDHKIGNDFVFPAAGYIAMAVEALSQVAEIGDTLIPLQGYTIQGLKITSALTIPSEGAVETMFNMTEVLSPAKGSSQWFEFRVSSVTEDEKWNEHGAGRIGLIERHTDSPEISNGKSWCTALSAVGVKFGPTFQALSNINLDSEKKEALGQLALQTTKELMPFESRYLIHPTALDGCLQLSVMAAQSNMKSVSKAFLPVLVEDITIWSPPESALDAKSAIVYGQGHLKGLRSVSGVAKVFSNDGYLLVDGRLSFLSLEGDLMNSDVVIPRQPYSRLVWKPDVDRLGALLIPQKFHFIDYINLLTHKARQLKVLQIGSESLVDIVKALHGDSPYPIYSHYGVLSYSELVIEDARNITHGFKNMNYQLLESEKSLIEQNVDAGAYDLVILSEVYKRDLRPLDEEIIRIAEKCGISVFTVPLLGVANAVPPGSKLIVTAEINDPLLYQMGEDELVAIHYLFKQMSTAVWITNGGLLDGFEPAKSLASGFAKILMNEQPSFRISCFDVEPQGKDLARSATFIVDQHVRLQEEKASEVEMHLVEKDGLVYISRFLPDGIENEAFERKINPPVEIGKFHPSPSLELDFQHVGKIDSFYYKWKNKDETNLGPEDVLVAPLAYSLSAEDVAVLKGQQESEHFSYESVARILAVGSQVTDFQEHDRVLVFKPGKFDSSFVVNQRMCQKLLLDEKVEELVGVLLPTCSAIHALRNMTRVRKGDVSPHITLSLKCRLDPFVTYKYESEKTYYRQVQNMSENYLIPTDVPTWTRSLIQNMKGQEPNVIIVSAASYNHQDLLKCLKKNGRYLLLKHQSDFSNINVFDKAAFTKSGSFISFDIFDMIKEGNEDISELLQEALNLYRHGVLARLPRPSVFDISQFSDAVLTASNTENLERIVLECNQHSNVPVTNYTPLEFDSSATYLMVGCLGGLGRSLSSWMCRRGARNFVFLSRSGATKPEAVALLKELELYAEQNDIVITAKVVRGDVSMREDVDKAISAAVTPIKGVIQAAATFQECLFEDMTVEKFHEVLDPKVRGTINLHEALIDQNLDFFVMTSSSLGIKAPATQSSYAAANAFLDSMARHRWSLSMQATSLSLGMVQEVGRIEENPEIESAMLLNGLYGIDEAEFLTMMELACKPCDLSSHSAGHSNYDPYSNAHIITGMERNRLDPTPAFEGVWLNDQRLQHLTLQHQASNAGQVTQNSSTVNTLAEAFKTGGEAAVKNAVRDVILGRFSKLLLIPVENLEHSMSRPLADLGMDSMITSDVRALAWKEFKADVPFLKILEKGLLLGELVELVWEKMDESLKHGGA
ncbi:fatty acid synthase [Xylogone sp. PMI_703]|nr:fatty acid synthase [Xylogone sp. PMI_703]